MKTYLVTGGAGFLGKRITSLICSKNIDEVSKIIIYDNKILPEDELLLQNKCQGKLLRSLSISFQFLMNHHQMQDYKSSLSGLISQI